MLYLVFCFFLSDYILSDNAETETSEEQSSIPYVEEEDDATAGKAPSQAELETELYKEVETPDKIYDNVEVMPEYPGGRREN
ncbi:hypothetical protein [Phocaeicola faecalis]